jgi:hypothetical protein
MHYRNIWRVVPDTNGFYQISDDGTIRKIKEECKKYSIQSVVKSIYEDVEYEIENVTNNFPSIKIPIKSTRKNWAISSLMY